MPRDRIGYVRAAAITSGVHGTAAVNAATVKSSSTPTTATTATTGERVIGNKACTDESGGG
jgi:hypothetical protein